MRMSTEQNLSSRKSKLISELSMVFLTILINMSSNVTIQVASRSSHLPPPTTEERTYRLSVVDQDSKAAMTAVSLNIDPSESTGGQQSGTDATPMFDSERMPVVKLK